ncbi:hypothetical protein ACIGXM_31730 [Kitasatospora sp. NPDC052896]|uniref:hypothetical protein n=1 Tax=Kitasatospora sp. NPDC052896 TaxID=3364061 RepID=UPI0037C74950
MPGRSECLSQVVALWLPRPAFPHRGAGQPLHPRRLRAGARWHVAEQNVDYWAWDPQLSLLGNTGANNRWAPTAARGGDGRLEDFVIATDRSLYVCAQKKVNVSDFADAAQLGGNLLGLPVPAKFHDNRIVVFHRGSDNAIWAFQQVFA